MSFEAVGIGDLHLTSSAGKGGLSQYIKEPNRVIAKLIEQPLAYAESKGIKHIIFYGDLCEGTRMSYEGQLALVSVLRNPKFTFHIILGNHDKISEASVDGHSLQIIKEFQFPNVVIYDGDRVVKLAGQRINFMPWPSIDFKEGCLNIAHVDVQGAKSDSGRVFDGEKLSRTDCAAVIGHIHTKQRIRNTHYSGTLYQTNFGESPKKYFHHIIWDGELEVINVPVKPLYRLHTVEVSSKDDLANLKASNRDLYKLILLEGCDVSAADYKNLRVEKVRSVSDVRDLALAHIEDLTSGSEVEVSSDEFLREWLKAQPVPGELKRQAYQLRKRLLGHA
jgi:DNA repair exonuclease SbcCD nuclease subunit